MDESSGTNAAESMARRLDLDFRGLQLLRFGENLTYDLPRSPYVLRVHRPDRSTLGSVLKELEAVRGLVGAGAPVTSPAPYAVAGPHVEKGFVISLWNRFENDPAAKVDAGSFGLTLRRLHDAGSSQSLDLDLWHPWPKIRRRLNEFRERVSTENHKHLVDLEHELANSSAFTPSGFAFAHGDAHSGNILTTGDEHVFCDFDSLSYAPPFWDLIPMIVAHRRLGLPAKELDSFLSGYGEPGLQIASVELLIRVRELSMVTWLMQVALPGTRAEQELQLRLRSLFGDSGEQWSRI